MKSKKNTIKKLYTIRLERDDEIHSCLKKFCEDNNIQGGIIYGIGTMSYVKVYAVAANSGPDKIEQVFEEPMELVYALGNASMINDKHLIHLHVTIGRKDKSTVSGHLLEGKISFTGEFFIIQTDEIERVSEDGMNQWKP